MVPLDWSVPHTRNKCTVTQPKACSSTTLGVSQDSGLHLDPLATLRHSTEANNLFMRMWWMMTMHFFLFSLECLDSFQNTVLTNLHIWDIKRATLPQRWQNSLNSPVLCYYHSKWSTAYITRENKGWTLTTNIPFHPKSDYLKSIIESLLTVSSWIWIWECTASNVPYSHDVRV